MDYREIQKEVMDARPQRNEMYDAGVAYALSAVEIKLDKARKEDGTPFYQYWEMRKDRYLNHRLDSDTTDKILVEILSIGQACAASGAMTWEEMYYAYAKFVQALIGMIS